MILLLRYAVEEIRVGDIFEDAQNNKNPFDEKCIQKYCRKHIKTNKKTVILFVFMI